MLSLLLPTVIGTPTIAHATNWNSTAWVIWWVLTALAIGLYLFGAHAIASYNSPIPGGIGLIMVVAGYIFLLVSVAQMFRHSPDGRQVMLILLAFFFMAAVTGIAAGVALGERARWGWIPGGFLVLWTVFGALNEAGIRVGMATGLAPGAVILFIIAAITLFIISIARR